jgi:hypothetical protein
MSQTSEFLDNGEDHSEIEVTAPGSDDGGEDYSTRLEQVLADESEDSDDEGIQYRHRRKIHDADVSTESYRNQLRDVLGPDEMEEEEEEEEEEASIGSNEHIVCVCFSILHTL